MSDISMHQQLLDIFERRARNPDENAAYNEIQNLRAEVAELKAQLAKAGKAEKPATPKKPAAAKVPAKKK